MELSTNGEENGKPIAVIPPKTRRKGPGRPPTPTDPWEAISQALERKAKKGDVQAARLWEEWQRMKPRDIGPRLSDRVQALLADSAGLAIELGLDAEYLLEQESCLEPIQEPCLPPQDLPILSTQDSVAQPMSSPSNTLPSI